MCTRPDRHSISTSAHALWDAALSLTFACGALLLALVSAPLRLLERRRPKSRRAATVGHVDVQVHLEDRKCVAEIKRVLRQTLRLTARTWAPLTLPIDRVVVGVGFPPGGGADVYDKFPAQTGKASAPGLRGHWWSSPSAYVTANAISSPPKSHAPSRRRSSP